MLKKDIDLTSLVRPHIQALRPYTSARDEFAGQAEVYLDANENPYHSLTGDAFNRYPDPHQRAVKERLAQIRGVQKDHIFLGNGSDEAIDLLIRAYCEPSKDHIMLLPPTYGMYQVSADINGIKTVAIPLKDDFSLAVGDVVAGIRAGTKLIFLCSPNNPTGNAFDPDQLATIIRYAPGLVVVDEAYIDFCPSKSMLPMLSEFPNLVVLQTFSKAWGMAHLRLGMAYADPAIISVLNRIKPPYNVNGLTQSHAVAALEKFAEMEAMVEKTVQARTQLAMRLSELPQVETVFPSDANFLLVRVKDALRYYRELIDQQIIVRNRSNVALCQGCLRITIGTEAENDRLVHTLASFS